MRIGGYLQSQTKVRPTNSIFRCHWGTLASISSLKSLFNFLHIFLDFFNVFVQLSGEI